MVVYHHFKYRFLRSILGGSVAAFFFFAPGITYAQQLSGKDSSENLKFLPDTVQPLRSKWKSFIAPASFIAYGGLSFFVHPVRQLDYTIHNERTEHFYGSRTTIDNYLQFAPIVAVYTLNLSGVKGKNALVDRTVLLVLSEAIFYGSTAFLKSAAGRNRPDESNRLSFPSGHTGSAFVAAEFLAQEYSGQSPWYGVGGYSIAGTTAILRIYNNKHWFSDIVAGAGFGIIATKAAYFIYPAIRRSIFPKIRQSKTSGVLLPTYKAGQLGFAFACSF